MGHLKLENIKSHIGDFTLGEINLEIKKNEYFILLGHSGSGKTKLLESIAGLNESSGSLFFDGEDVSKIAPEHRNIGFVYQDFALFPNLNVEKNIKFASKYKSLENINEYFLDIVEFLKLDKLLSRDVRELSGGEKQRVAIARALYSRPNILLLDEPLSAIDPSFRSSIMNTLKSIHKRYNLTTIHVTHNFREASYLADKIAIIMDGVIEQIGTSSDVLRHPVNMKVAKFLGFKNIFPISMVNLESKSGFYSLDPNAIQISQEHIQADFIFDGIIEECIEVIDHFKILINAKEHKFFIKISKRNEQNPSEYKEKVKIGFNKEDIIFI